MNLNVLTSFTVSLMGCVLIAVLLWRSRKTHVWMLAISLFAFAYTCFLIFLFESKYLLNVPYFFRTSGITSYISTPALFLYCMVAMNVRKKLQWTDLLHLTPVIIYLIDFAPILLSSNDTKRAVIQELFKDPSAVLRYRENWLLPENVHYAARHVISLGYLTYLTVLLARKRAHISGIRNNKCVFNWLVTVTVLYTSYSSLAIFTFTFFSAHTGWTVMIIDTLAVFTVITFTLFLKPVTLYGSMHSLVAVRVNKKNVVLTEEQISFLDEKMGEFTLRQLYLKSGMTLKALADELKTQPYLLSAYINKRYGMHFNDLINYHRVQYVKKRMITDQQSYTLEGIALEAGFNNRTTFVNAFKKFTGYAPSTYALSHRDKA